MHVALVGRLRVDGERAEPGARGLGLHHRELHVAEPHAAPFGRHVREPQALLLRGLAHLDDAFDEALAIVLVDARLDRAHHLVDERAHLRSDFFELGGETEVDGHARSVVRS